MTAAELLERAETRVAIKAADLADWLRQLALKGWVTETEEGFFITDTGRRWFSGIDLLLSVQREPTPGPPQADGA